MSCFGIFFTFIFLLPNVPCILLAIIWSLMLTEFYFKNLQKCCKQLSWRVHSWKLELVCESQQLVSFQFWLIIFTFEISYFLLIPLFLKKNRNAHGNRLNGSIPRAFEKLESMTYLWVLFHYNDIKHRLVLIL